MDIKNIYKIVPIKYLILFLIIFSLTLFVFFSTKNKYKQIKTNINGQEILLEVADSPAKRTKGLMFVKELPENEGMLFTFPNEAQHPFWMANTFISLDIIWLNSNKEIVYVEKNVSPCTESVKSACKIYKPNEKAKYVIELNSGKTEQLGLEIGYKVNFDL